MKITFRDATGNIIRVFNDPFGRELKDIIAKPLSKIVKIIYTDGRIDEYTMLDREYEVVNELKNDLEELRVQYVVKDSDR